MKEKNNKGVNFEPEKEENFGFLIEGCYCWDYKARVTGKIVHFQKLELQMLLLCT